MLEFTRTGVGEYHHYVHGFSDTVVVQLVLYLFAISLVERCPANRWTLGIILLIALAERLVAVAAPPFLSSDIYRYVWDGMVQGAGINPFRYIPADSHLAFLRDAGIYPNINRREYAHTIYPPGSQIIFWVVTRISPTVTAMKLAMVGFEAVTCYALIRCLKLLHMQPERVLPVCMAPGVPVGDSEQWARRRGSGHFYFACRVLARLDQTDDTLSGGWLGAAALVKLYPIGASARISARGRCECPPWVALGVMATGYSLLL